MELNNASEGPTLWFDAECVLCNRSVHFILKHEKDHRLKFGSLQSPTGRALQARVFQGETFEGMIYVSENNEIAHSSDALIAAARHIRAPWSVIAWIRWIPHGLRNQLYAWIANNRHNLLKPNSDKCIVPTPEMRARMVSGNQ